MTAKTETNFWKSLKTCLNDGNFVVSRIESYVTPGFPDCVVFHKDTGFFTLELKVLKRNKNGTETVLISPYKMHGMSNIVCLVHLYLLWYTTQTHAP
jgi:hypothetical protein